MVNIIMILAVAGTCFVLKNMFGQKAEEARNQKMVGFRGRQLTLQDMSVSFGSGGWVPNVLGQTVERL